MSSLRPCAHYFALFGLFGLCGIAALPSHAQAAFDGGHSPGLRLSGQGGATGWASAWSGTGAAVTDRKLSDPTGRLPAPASSVTLRAEGGDFLSISRRTAFEYGQPGTTEWFSFVIVRTRANPRATAPPAYGGVALGGNPSLFVGDPGDGHWGMDTSGPPALKGVVDAGPIVADVPAFLVVRADFQANAARLTLYQDPEPGLPAPNVPGVVKTDLALTPGHSVTLTFGNGSAYALGAMRLGRSYAAVAPAASKHAGP